jgi:hypothetical protein
MSSFPKLVSKVNELRQSLMMSLAHLDEVRQILATDPPTTPPPAEPAGEKKKLAHHAPPK